MVGFAAETGDETHSYLQYGQLKAQRKGADLMVINKVGNGSGFGDVDTVVSIVNNRGEIRAEYEGNKADIAAHIVLSIEQWTSQHFS